MPGKSNYLTKIKNCIFLTFFDISNCFILNFFFFRIIVMGTNEKIGVNIHVDQLMDTIASNLPQLERLELR